MIGWTIAAMLAAGAFMDANGYGPEIGKPVQGVAGLVALLLYAWVNKS